MKVVQIYIFHIKIQISTSLITPEYVKKIYPGKVKISVKIRIKILILLYYFSN